MEEDMEVEHEHFFIAHEIDLDYEFDAARFFDFTRPESPSQAHQAEIWFHTAPSYPPSPFVTKLVMGEDMLAENANANASLVMDDGEVSVLSAMEYSESHVENQVDMEEGGHVAGLLGGILQNVANEPLQVTTGFTFHSKNKTNWDNRRSKAKSAASKRSTLMKPTASQLAKQNRRPQVVGSRMQKLPGFNSERSISAASGVESQAAKRQKLDCGLLRKVADMKQQANFFHKAPKTVVTVEQNTVPSKVKITIPLEPELETAQRAQRIRPKNVAVVEHATAGDHRFKARPLNRKILEAPSLPLPKRSTPRLPAFQEFHLKTSERAMQHTSASSSSSLQCNDFDKGFDKPNTVSVRQIRIKDIRRPTKVMSAVKQDNSEFTHNFKARPLNKKILASKGNIGVFLNTKQETTVPVGFNFHTEKRVRQNPPIELFSKLSLTSELHPNNGSQTTLSSHSNMLSGDSKENILSSIHPVRKEMHHMLGGRQNQCVNNDCNSKASTIFSARRSLGIR